MTDKVISSISFVINAAYTYTFANAAAFTLVDENAENFSLDKVDASAANIMCGSIALVMTLRYFFGNNAFMYEVFSNQVKTKYVRFFHFGIVVMQSVVLLVASFEIRKPWTFFVLLAVLFFIEFVWYAVCLKIDRAEVVFVGKSDTKEFLYAQWYGIVVVIVIGGAVAFGWIQHVYMIASITGLFVIDTIWDLRRNLSKYMDTAS